MEDLDFLIVDWSQFRIPTESISSSVRLTYKSIETDLNRLSGFMVKQLSVTSAAPPSSEISPSSCLYLPGTTAAAGTPVSHVINGGQQEQVTRKLTAPSSSGSFADARQINNCLGQLIKKHNEGETEITELTENEQKNENNLNVKNNNENNIMKKAKINFNIKKNRIEDLERIKKNYEEFHKAIGKAKDFVFKIKTKVRKENWKNLIKNKIQIQRKLGVKYNLKILIYFFYNC